MDPLPDFDLDFFLNPDLWGAEDGGRAPDEADQHGCGGSEPEVGPVTGSASASHGFPQPEAAGGIVSDSTQSSCCVPSEGRPAVGGAADTMNSPGV